MRSEVDIRREVEAHLRRRGLFLLDGGLWAAAVVFLWQFTRYSGFGTTLSGLIVLFMLGWTAALGLHFLRTVYVEVREWLVRRAIQREREFYVLQDAYEKRKRDFTPARLENRSDARLGNSRDFTDARLENDGELIDFPGWDDATKTKRER